MDENQLFEREKNKVWGFGEETDEAMNRYYELFNDDVPEMIFKYSLEEMLKIINKCISEKKDVYDLEYLSLDNMY